MSSTVAESTNVRSGLSANDVPNLNITAPGAWRVVRRNGEITPFDIEKIVIAITGAMLDVEGDDTAAEQSARIKEKATFYAKKVQETFSVQGLDGNTLRIEDIQDKVEKVLMLFGEYEVAREYILYREERRKEREQHHDKRSIPTLHVTKKDGSVVPLDHSILLKTIQSACQHLEAVNPELILEHALNNLFDKVSIDDVSTTLVMSARALIETEPNYTFATARLLLNKLKHEALAFLGFPVKELETTSLSLVYPEAFKHFIERGIELELLNPKLKAFDLERLSKAIRPERDNQHTYLGLQTLYDRYFIHQDNIRFELPQVFFMRVAMGLALAEKQDQTTHAIDFYNLLSSFDYMSSTPTLFNSGTLRPQLSSCFLTTIPDHLEGIYGSIRDNAMLSKFAGGIGNDWTRVRALGAHIKGTNGKSLGVVPFMNVADATAIAVNQGGRRKGAVCGYLEIWHKDYPEFLELRKNTGDERRRTHDMNTASWIPDLFMKRLFEKKDWTLFSPDDVPELHDCFGKEFEEHYLAYEEKFAKGDISGKAMSTETLWRKMLGMLYETGHPWITFKDPCNLRSPQQHAGVIHSSNLCTEITLNTSDEEVAVCNLGSVNLVNHTHEDGLDMEHLEKTVTTAMRMLDNVIDINYYTIPQARRSNLKHRPVGMGCMGFQDAIYKQKIPYSSEEAVAYADKSMEAISYFAISASSNLAEERGTYPSYEGSLWSKGILPIDSIELLQASRGKYLQQDRRQTMDWDKLRTRVATIGMRNSNTLAIAPTATISNICGVSQSIEPTYQNLFVKSNMSGEFTVVNAYLVKDLKARGLWDKVMINDLKYYDGSVSNISRIPGELKVLYATAFEIEPKWLIDAASRRQKWIDQSQSLNLYMAEPSGKKLDILYRMAWLSGLKTTYYLRSMGATNAEKSTITDGALNSVSIKKSPKACAIDDPDCEACQ